MAETTAQRALVGFHGAGRFVGSQFLRRGFRHVLVAINDGRAWMVIDPRLDRIVIDVSLPAEFDLARAWRDAGLTVIETAVASAVSPVRALVPAPMTCVEVVKRVLGLRRAAIMTPYSLYRHLTRRTKHGSIVQSLDPGAATVGATAANLADRRPGIDRKATATSPCRLAAARSHGQHSYLGPR
jgi:hypothetical protein